MEVGNNFENKAIDRGGACVKWCIDVLLNLVEKIVYVNNFPLILLFYVKVSAILALLDAASK